MSPIPPPPCIEYVKKMIEKDKKSEKYIIPQNLDMTDIPQKVVDSFLEWLNENSRTEWERQVLLKAIKEGHLVIECD